MIPRQDNTCRLSMQSLVHDDSVGEFRFRWSR